MDYISTGLPYILAQVGLGQFQSWCMGFDEQLDVEMMRDTKSIIKISQPVLRTQFWNWWCGSAVIQIETKTEHCWIGDTVFNFPT